MSEIPQDIREKAAEATRDIIGFACSEPDVDHVARAILAHERETIERCAKIPQRIVENEGIEDGEAIELCNRIVDAIWETSR